jgi:hypothetical protein
MHKIIISGTLNVLNYLRWISQLKGLRTPALGNCFCPWGKEACETHESVSFFLKCPVLPSFQMVVDAACNVMIRVCLNVLFLR